MREWLMSLCCPVCKFNSLAKEPLFPLVTLAAELEPPWGDRLLLRWVAPGVGLGVKRWIGGAMVG